MIPWAVTLCIFFTEPFLQVHDMGPSINYIHLGEGDTGFWKGQLFTNTTCCICVCLQHFFPSLGSLRVPQKNGGGGGSVLDPQDHPPGSAPGLKPSVDFHCVIHAKIHGGGLNSIYIQMCI